MLRASLYIIGCSAKNRVRARIRRLREPRYLVGAIAGAAYLYFALFMRIGARGSRGVRSRGRPGVQPPAGILEGSFRGIAPAAAGAGMLALAALAWVIPSGSTLFELSDAETHLLCPAPVTRRQLLIHRLMRSQLGMLFASIAVAFVVTAPQLSAGLGLGSASVRLTRGLAFWVVFATVRVYFAGVTIARARLASADTRVRLFAWTPLLITVAAVAVVAVPVWRSLASRPVTSFLDLAVRAADATAAGWPRIALWPFAALTAPLFTEWPGPYLAAIAGAIAVLAVTVEWVLRSDEAFQAGGDAQERQQQERRPSVRGTTYSTNVRWPLPLSGRTDMLFFWKNGMQTLRGTSLMAVLPYLLPLVVIVVVGSTARMSAAGRRGPAAAFAMASLFMAGFWTLIGPQTMRCDLRGDLPHLDLLKTWPVKSSTVIRGELLWPTTVLTLCAWLALACGAIFSTAAFPELPLTSRLALAAAAIILAPALVGAQFAVHNAAAVLFPAWVSSGAQRPRGLDAMGQRLILFGGVLIALVLMIGPGAIAGALITFVFYRFLGMVSLVPAAAVCLAIVVIEILLVTDMLGAAYDRIDFSEVERPE